MAELHLLAPVHENDTESSDYSLPPSDDDEEAEEEEEEEEEEERTAVKRYGVTVDHAVLTFLLNEMQHSSCARSSVLVKKLQAHFVGRHFTPNNVTNNFSRMRLLGVAIYDAKRKYEHALQQGDEAKIASRKMFAESGVYTVYRYYRKIEWTDEEKEILCAVGKSTVKTRKAREAQQLRAHGGLEVVHKKARMAPPSYAKRIATVKQMLGTVIDTLMKIDESLSAD